MMDAESTCKTGVDGKGVQQKKNSTKVADAADVDVDVDVDAATTTVVAW